MLILHRPELLGRPCRDCQAFHYEDDAGPVRTDKKREFGHPRRPMPRHPGESLPCDRCIKGNPEQGAAIERELPRVLSTLDIYYQSRATSGASLTPAERQDGTLRNHLGICDRVVTQAEGRKAMEPVMQVLEVICRTR